MKYKTKNSLKVLTGVMLCSGLLAACHGGSNGNGNNISNTAVSTTKTANPSQTLLRISNDTGAVIDNVVLLSESGHMVYQSNSGLDCANKQSCILDIGGVITDKTMLAKFYNDKNQLISIASLKDNSQKLAYTSIYTNNIIFGAHLFKQLVIFEHSTPASVLEQLNKYFTANNTDGNHNVFGDLGNYYIQQLKNGQIHNEDQFYKNLSTAFAAHKTISSPVPQASPPLRMAPALGCNHGIGEEVSKWLEPLGELGGEVTKSIAGFGSAIFSTICPAEEFDFEGAFDKLNEKLDTIQETLQALGTDVAELRKTMVGFNADNVAVNMDALYNKEIDYNQVYLNFLSQAKTKSLSEFVDEKGGIDNINAGDKIFDSNIGLIGSIRAQNSNMRLLTSNAVLNQLTDVVKSNCNNPSTITDAAGKPADVIAARKKCNMEVVETGLYMAALAQQSKLRMTDVVNAINTSKDLTKFSSDNNFSDNGKSVIWENVTGVINNDTESRLANIYKFMRETYIEPTAGLPEQLLATLKENKVNCESSTTPSGVNGIMEWYGSAAKPYVVTRCKNGKEWVSSKFVYGGDKVIRNILGSLSSTTKDQTSNSIETFDKVFYNGFYLHDAHEYVVQADKNMKLAISTYEDAASSLYTPINNNWKTNTPSWTNNPSFINGNKITFYWNREDGSNTFHTRIALPNMKGNLSTGYKTSKLVVINYLKDDFPHTFFIDNTSNTSHVSKYNTATLHNKLTLYCGDGDNCVDRSDDQRIVLKFSDGTRIRLDGGGLDIKNGSLKLCDVTDKDAEYTCASVPQDDFGATYIRSSTSTPGNKICSLANTPAGCPTELKANDNEVNSIISNNGRYKLFLQQDGNLVIYNSVKKGVRNWQGSSKNGFLVLDAVGNLIAYKHDGTVGWTSNTSGADRLEMQDDGNLVLYKGTTPLWASNTEGK